MFGLKVIPLHNNQSKLLKKALQQDRDAQQKLYELYASKMLSVCRQYVDDIHHAEDVMITGFTKVFNNLHAFRGEGSFEGWIRRIMIREAITFLRSQKKMIIYTDEVFESENSNLPYQDHLEVNDIQQLIDELPEGYRMVFLMYAVEGYKHQEIAEALQITESTSKSQLFKARKLLQQKLQQLNKRDHGTS